MKFRFVKSCMYCHRQEIHTVPSWIEKPLVWSLMSYVCADCLHSDEKECEDD